MDEDAPKKRVPVLRGKIHIGILLLYSLFLYLLVKRKLNLPYKLGFFVMMACSLINFSVVIVLHNVYWTNLNRSLIRRIDYAGVFGSLLSKFAVTPKWFRSLVYVLTAAPYFHLLYLFFSTKIYATAAFMICAAAFYILGSIFYAAQAPNLVPGVFGHHELFHLFCSFGFISTALMNFSILRYEA